MHRPAAEFGGGVNDRMLQCSTGACRPDRLVAFRREGYSTLVEFSKRQYGATTLQDQCISWFGGFLPATSFTVVAATGNI